MLLCKQQSVSQQAGAAIQSALGGNPCQFRKVITFREMTKNHIRSLTVVLLFQEFRCRFIGKMTYPR